MTLTELFNENYPPKNIKKGEFHKWAIEKGFIKSMDEEIPCKAICAGLKDKDPRVRKMANFANNFGKGVQEHNKCDCK